MLVILVEVYHSPYPTSSALRMNRLTDPSLSETETVIIYTDGACSGNPGPGGWGAVLGYGEHEKELSGYMPDTTNNRMELLAAIRALEHLSRPCDITLYTDSSYVKNGITQWIHGWKRRGWKKADNKPVLNADLWRKLDAIAAKHQVSWQWIKGHAGHPGNEHADTLARNAISAGRSGSLEPDTGN